MFSFIELSILFLSRSDPVSVDDPPSEFWISSTTGPIALSNPDMIVLIVPPNTSPIISSASQSGVGL